MTKSDDPGATQMKQRVLVCGGRKFADVDLVYATLDQAALANPISFIVSGMATGADSIGVMWADENHVLVDPYPAEWQDLSQPDALVRTRRDGTKYDARAGFRRNQKMIDIGKPHLVIAFPGGGGTADMVRRAKAAKIPVVEVRAR